ncbi:free fatty acid receptor 3 [Brienomyrus brachyistius]|uniref:free fatty acid receptor 3 n=1 Tax=Brienomyrus brachyistius TaxID=42636 RepID=UPI0020B30202|nr:free fatty acid receptor 3 [Brienomyrus brachyistius]
MTSGVAARDSVFLTVYSVTFLLGLPANLLVLAVFVRKVQKRGATPNVVYALNLCTANLVLVVWLPVKAAEILLETWALPEPLCPAYSFFLFASLYGSCLMLTAMSVGRYLSIAFPISYKMYRRAQLSCCISAGLWALVLLHLSLALVAEENVYFVSTRPHDNSSACYENFTPEQLKVLLPLRLEMAILLFLLPLVITATCTLRCLMLVQRSSLSLGRKKRVLAVALSTFVVFVVCYSPYNLSHVVGFVQGRNVSWRQEAMLSSSCNVFLQPVVMLLLSPGPPRCLRARLCGRQAPGLGLFCQTLISQQRLSSSSDKQT